MQNLGMQSLRERKNLKNTERLNNVYQKGITVKRVAEKLGVDLSTAHKWMKGNHLETAEELNKKVFIKTINKCVYEGKSLQEIADKLNVEKSRVLYYIKQYGLKSPKELKIEIMRDILEGKLTDKELAKKFNLPVSQIKKMHENRYYKEKLASAT